jgi:hypothetical protein
MSHSFTIERALADEHLLGAALGSLETWATWVAVLKAAFGLKLTRSERRVFETVAGSRKPPRQKQKCREVWAIVGRRGGKSRMAGALAVYLALFVDHSARLAKGETGYVLVLAPTVAQSKLVFSYAKGFIESSPILRQQIESIIAHEIRLKGNIVIAVHPASFRSVRGRTIVAAVLDETAYWNDEASALSDVEAYRAILPALATTGGMLIGISSPYRKSGLLFTKHRDHFGKDDDDVLVVAGSSKLFNPTLSDKIIAAAERDDPEAARSEWGAEFRSDINALLDDDVIDAAIDYSRPLELPFRRGVSYVAFADASAGRHDAFTLCIGHAEERRFVADAVRGRKPPFDPGEVAREYAALVKNYGLTKIVGDAYAGEWVAGAFRDCGLSYEPSPLPKSAIYVETLPQWNQARVRIPDMPSLVKELRQLERRVHRGGKDSVDHPRNGSDDYANVVAGALYLAIRAESPKGVIRVGSIRGVCTGIIDWRDDDPPPRPELRIVTWTEKEYFKAHGRSRRW